MKLGEALRIGKECGLETVQEALSNISGHAMNMFPYDDINSELTAINGVGEKTAKKLLKDFKSVKSIKTQNIKALTVSVGIAKANIVFNHFHN